jgi:fatty-acyl-CoA synthase
MQTLGSLQTNSSPAKAWLRALELTSSIASTPERILATVIEENAARFGDAPALLSDRESLTYSQLSERANRYARWALSQGLRKGDVICLLMTSRPEYMAIWLGITSVGVIVSLLNTQILGESLSHCIRTVSPKLIIVGAECFPTLIGALSHGVQSLKIWALGSVDAPLPRIDLDIARYSGARLGKEERGMPVIDDLALYIYTSGTTGLPKAANVSHGRVMQWTHWFSGMMDVKPADRMYNTLPMYHSVGGVQAVGATLVAGGSVVIREKFSASHFWSDILRWDCTLFQYIGELCRYLLHAPPSANETEHRIRLACGNGLAPEVWDAFKDRFHIPRILEFYAATEGAVSLFNVQGKRGAIGHIPPYLAHRFSPSLVAFDFATGAPVRAERGFCIRCTTNEVGEAISKLVDDPSNIGNRFEGYTSQEATENRVLRDVFEAGDAWIRTGDLMRKDEKGFFYFVDRVGDTFRWKGENVATSEVAKVICTFTGIKQASVYGVSLPATEGRAGMVTLVSDHEIDFVQFRKHLAARLPSYARPMFLRVRRDVEVTGTFKYSKTELMRQGYDPTASSDAVYFDYSELGAFVPLDKELYDRIQSGGVRL